MTDFKTIYSAQADLYDQLVSQEDYLGNITNAIATIRHLPLAKVVEFGAGTGRLTRFLASQAKQIIAFDLYPHMLKTLANRINHPTFFAVGDNHAMPLPSESADITIAGWSFGHAIGWYPDNWGEHIEQMVSEMRRITRPSGTMMIVETLGTGYTMPTPPNEGLSQYYTNLKENGFTLRWVRSDYRFESVEQAEMLIRFFFGDELADRVRDNNMLIVPECTGIWWKHV